jgi:hypothetical protein
VEPLVLWLWVGGFVIVIGALLSMWPSSRDRKDLLAAEQDGAHAGQAGTTVLGEEPAEAGVGAPV